MILRKDLHELFHKKYGYKNNTADQFLDFLDNILTGSLGDRISQGSETRARITELQERLNKLKNSLVT